jgi:FixJ family two-component response regulator
MPGMSGHELAGKLSSQRPKMKVVYTSGYTDGAVATHGVLESGVVILRKPFSRAQLQQSVGQMLGGNPGKGETLQNAEHADRTE